MTNLICNSFNKLLKVQKTFKLPYWIQKECYLGKEQGHSWRKIREGRIHFFGLYIFLGAQSYKQIFFCISDQILRFLKISTDFQIVFLSKYSEENFQKSVQPVAPKNLSEKFSNFSKKIGGFKLLTFLSENFSEFRLILIGLSPGGLGI